jgi:hypothetical protein
MQFSKRCVLWLIEHRITHNVQNVVIPCYTPSQPFKISWKFSPWIPSPPRVSNPLPSRYYSPVTILTCVSGANLCYGLSKHYGLARPQGLGKLVEFNYLIRSRTRDLPACNIVLQPLRYRALPLRYGHCGENLNSNWRFRSREEFVVENERDFRRQNDVVRIHLEIWGNKLCFAVT